MPSKADFHTLLEEIQLSLSQSIEGNPEVDTVHKVLHQSLKAFQQLADPFLSIHYYLTVYQTIEKTEVLTENIKETLFPVLQQAMRHLK